MKRLTSTDIAKLAGVSRSTVSRVINNYPNVPEATRQRVMEVIQENHYYPQLSGQLLSGMKSRTIGLFWLSRSSIAPDSLSSSYFMHIVDAATAHGYMVLSCILGDLSDEKNEQFVRRVFMEGRVEAGIFVGARAKEPLIAELLDMGMIVGAFDYGLDVPHSENCIMANFEPDSGEKAVDHLVTLGHRRIATIVGDLNRLSCINRYDSYRHAMEAHGLPCKPAWCVTGGITRRGGYEAAMQLLQGSREDMPTAIFANNDNAAFGVYEACQELGLRIPEDISVIGVDGHANAAHIQPPLTTVSFDFRSMFRGLVDRVIAAIEQQESVETVVQAAGELIERDSCRRL